MSWKDELNNVKKVFANGTTKEKIEYIWDYYKWHLIVLALLCSLIGNLIYTNLTAKDYALRGIFLNVFAEEDRILEFKEDFMEKFPIDSATQDMLFDTSLYYLPKREASTTDISYQTMQTLSAKIAAGEVDFLVADVSILKELTYNEYFLDLSDVLTEEQLKKYQDCLLYYDKSLLEQLYQIDFSSGNNLEITFPDPTKPELMEDPVPIMLCVSDSEKISNFYPNTDKEYGIAWIINGENREKTIDFLEFLLS